MFICLVMRWGKIIEGGRGQKWGFEVSSFDGGGQNCILMDAGRPNAFLYAILFDQTPFELFEISLS